MWFGTMLLVASTVASPAPPQTKHAQPAKKAPRAAVQTKLRAAAPVGCCCLWKTSTVKDCSNDALEETCKADAKAVSVGERYRWHEGKCRADE